MAELAVGAVGSLLGVLQAHAQLLRRVGNDVEFIKEEMESMNSFLVHLARTAPPSGWHDEQVQTWMKQVRELAHDCSNCIERYLLRGDPAIHRARGGLRGHFWWAYWLVNEFIAKNEAATRLRELKERAGDVGKRRLRYGVEVPGKPAMGGSTSSSTPVPSSSSTSSQAVAALPAAEDDDEDEDDGQHHALETYQQALERPSLDIYLLKKISSWVEETKQATEEPMRLRSIAIVASGTETNESAIISEGLTTACAQFERTVWIKLPLVHYTSDKLGPNKVLFYILRVCMLQKEHGNDKWKEENVVRFSAWSDGRMEKRKIREQFEAKVDARIKQLENKLEDMESKMIEKTGVDNKSEETQGGNMVPKFYTTEEAADSLVQTDKPLELEDMESKMIEKTGVDNKCEETQGRNMVPKFYTTKEAKDSLVQTDKPLGVLYLALHRLLVPGDDDGMKIAKDVIESDEENIILETARRLNQHMETGVDRPPIHLHDSQYQGILRELFLTSNPQEAQGTTIGTTSSPAATASATLGDDQIKEIMGQIKEIIGMVKKDIQEEIPSTKSHGLREEKLQHDQIAHAIQVAKMKLPQITLKIKKQFVIKGIVDIINEYLQDTQLLIILQDENRRRGPKWEDIMHALELLNCAKGSAVLVTTNDSQKAKDFCYPPREPITYSLVGFYHDIVLKFTRQQVDNKDGNYSSQILRDILDKCHPHEFCMKMFTAALYANPNRSNTELQRLCDALQDSENSLAINAKKIFKFSYSDMPREYRSCLLYLAVFPQGDYIRRSTLIGRWLTEGLITKQDWPTAVRHAERCFDALVDRWLVCPGDISAKGEFKSCMVGDLVHGFISKIAKKQHILDARLSNHLAWHFSIFSGIRLRASDSIDKFVKNPHNCSPQLSLLKLLDLQGCQCLDKKTNYLEAICISIPFLKYLSLRETNVTHLPTEINKLHDLEILDIRQTRIPVKETRHILLLKLKRLLAGDKDSSESRNGTGIANRKQKSVCSCVSIPYKIEKMENLEVLSNVMPSSHGNELKDISRLWELTKLGIVINDTETHLLNLLQAIGDLKECLRSISITIPETSSKDPDPNHKLLPQGIYSRLVQPPKVLESVSINGLTNRVRLLSLLGKGSNELAKVALCGTMLNQRYLKVLDSLPKLCCIKLRHCAYKDDEFIFNKGEFEHLKCLYVDGHNMTVINFKEGAAVALEKIVLSSTKVRSLLGVGHLPVLKELELKGNNLFAWFTGDGGAPTELVSPLKNRAAPWESTGVVSPSEDEAAAQKGTGVSPLDDFAAPEKKTERKINFRKGEFQHLMYFVFEDSNIVNIIFENGAAPELGKIILSMSNNESKLTVSSSLPKLKEIEVKGDKSIFLSLFINADKIAKVSLCDTLLNKGDHIYKHLSVTPSMCCLELLDNSYDESQLTFVKDEFGNLNLLIIKCSKIRDINFHSRSCRNLEKIIWFYSECGPRNEIQISGMDNIEKLKELELNGNYVPRQLRQDIKAHKNKPVLRHDKPQQKEDKAHENKQGDAPCFPHFTTSYFSKKKDQQ